MRRHIQKMEGKIPGETVAPRTPINVKLQFMVFLCGSISLAIIISE